MKNINIKKSLKKLIAMGTFSFVLVITGCSSKENNAEIENTVTKEIENNNESTNTEDNEIVKYFEEKQEEINNIAKDENGLLYKGGFEAANEVWHEFFIDAVDIIFYDKEYEGSSFSKLNPEAQAKCLDIIKDLENTINEINPNWKEDFGKIKDSTAEAYSNLLDSIEELIGTDNYNKIKDFKDSLKDSLSDIGNSLKDSANNWYQGYKSKNK
ncbi:MAG TPA: hypothetical protein IAB59_03645 [Candidatus Onthousia faecipullorum]|uniref:Lipoprotein n=1 Tax=Candidatus Onthousia faecipullorum TaxID=2840887 RepID=A0A9D1KBV6_9FIRM|nr:hypothetical protein [Candidatus Onthousia faecipullorum]